MGFVHCVTYIFWLCALLHLRGVYTAFYDDVNLFVKDENIEYEVLPEFLSMSLSWQALENVEKGGHLDVTSKQLKLLASNLAPANVRIGGKWSNLYMFSADGKDVHVPNGQWDRRVGSSKYWTKSKKNRVYLRTIKGENLKKAIRFFMEAGWSVTLNLNGLLMSPNLSWSSANAKLLLSFLKENGLEVKAFILGYEPDQYKARYGLPDDVSNLINSIKLLKAELKSPKYDDFFAQTTIIGPGVSSLLKAHALNFYKRFFSGEGPELVSAVGIHYCAISRQNMNQLAQFKSLKVYAHLQDIVEKAASIVIIRNEVRVQIRARVLKEEQTGNKVIVARSLPLHLSQFEPVCDGGVPDWSLDFYASFLWLDTLGLAAKTGVSQINRNFFLKTYNGLVSPVTYTVTPDYYVSVLHKRLVRGRTLKLSFRPALDNLRIYGHCARIDHIPYRYQDGDVVVYYINFAEKDLELRSILFQHADLDLFELRAQSSSSLTLIRDVALNGKNLSRDLSSVKHEDLELKPKTVKGFVKMAPMSLGFIVIKNISYEDCVRYKPRYSKSSGAKTLEPNIRAQLIGLAIMLMACPYLFFA